MYSTEQLTVIVYLEIQRSARTLVVISYSKLMHLQDLFFSFDLHVFVRLCN